MNSKCAGGYKKEARCNIHNNHPRGPKPCVLLIVSICTTVAVCLFSMNDEGGEASVSSGDNGHPLRPDTEPEDGFDDIDVGTLCNNLAMEHPYHQCTAYLLWIINPGSRMQCVSSHQAQPQGLLAPPCRMHTSHRLVNVYRNVETR